MPKRFLKFGKLSPDSQDRDNNTLERADNALPIFNSYRSIRKKAEVAAPFEVGGEVNGMHVHFYTKLVGEQVGYPVDNASNSDGAWVAAGGDTEETDLYVKIDDAGPNDNDRIVAGDAPTDATALIKLSNLAAPSTTSGSKIKYRYKVTGHSGAPDWTLDINLNEPADGSTNQVSITQETGSADTDGWIDGEFAIPDTSGFSDWTDLWLEIIASATGDGDQVVYPDDDYDNRDLWTKEDGTTVADLFESLDNDGDAQYVESPALSAGDEAEFVVDVADTEDPVVHTGHSLAIRHQAAVANVNAEITLEETGDAIASTTVENLGTGSWVDTTLSLSEAEAATINSYKNLKIRYRAYMDEDAGAAAVDDKTFATSLVRTNGSWTASAGTLTTAVGDNTDTVAQTAGAANEFIEWAVGATDPGSNKNHVLAVRLKADVATTRGVWVTFGQGPTFQIIDGSGTPSAGSETGLSISSGLSERWYITPSTGQTTFTYTLSEAEAAKITNYGILQVLVYAAGSQKTTIEKVYLQTAGQSTVKVSRLQWTVPDESRVEVSQANIRIPTQYESSVGDIVEIYAGTPEKLWQVDRTGWSNVSRTAAGSPAYQNLADPIVTVSDETDEYAHSWDFASWGTNIVATNYVDPVQKKAPADSVFSDLFTSDHKPRGRFVGVVNNFLVLAKIKFDSTMYDGAGTPGSDGESDEVWWSAIDNFVDMDPDVTTQCDRQRLLSTPGEITGFVGGEYGIIFKRNSIYRMNFSGAPFTFTFDLVSVNEGTKFWRSIVPVGNDIYFYGNGSFRVLRDGYQLERVGDEDIVKTIIDEEFEDDAMVVIDSNGEIDRETEKDASIVGDYDRLSGLIFWSYRRKGDNGFRNSGLLMYNPVEDRWGLAKDTGLRLCAIRSLPVSDDVGDSISRNVVAAAMGTDATPADTKAALIYFNDVDSYGTTFKTKILSAAYIAETSTKIGSNLTLRDARVIFKADEVLDNTGGASLLVECSDDPLMQTDVQTDTVTFDRQNRDGWLPLVQMSGEYFRFTLTFPSLSNQSVKEFDGIQVRWVSSGEF